VKNISDKVKNNIISIDAIDDSIINEHLYTQNLPDVDLLIRTSEHGISNFFCGRLLTQSHFRHIMANFKSDLYRLLLVIKKRTQIWKTSEQIK
jgi:undecaprenyl diphosphate synthase